MRYIRTKDGKIIDVERLFTYRNFLNYDAAVLLHCIKDNDFNREGWKRRVEKTADTIEDLCDVLVVEEQNIYNDGIHKYLMEQPFIFEKYGDFSKTLSVKGAIWTDKGLIYVAKLNKNGGFELL